MMPPYVHARYPLYWQNEQTGKLREAVTAYLNNRIDGETVTENQICPTGRVHRLLGKGALLGRTQR